MASEDRIYGRRAVLEAILAGRRPIIRILVARGLRGTTFRDVIDEAQKAGIQVQEIDRKRLTSIAGSDTHQGILAIATPVAGEGLSAILAHAYNSGQDPFVLIADSIQDPQNLGAIIRSAEAAGVHGIVLPDRRIAPVDRATAKASAGAVEHMIVCHVGNLAMAVATLRDEGLKIYAADAGRGAGNLYEADLSGGIALVIGSEDRGVSLMVRERCTGTLRIPMRGKVASLNASAAAAVMLFEVVRRRSSSGGR